MRTTASQRATGWKGAAVAVVAVVAAALSSAPAPAQTLEVPETSARAKAGQRYVEQAVRFTRAKQYDKAIDALVKAREALPFDETIPFNIVMLAEERKAWETLWRYGLNYLHVAPSGEDAAAVRRRMQTAERALARRGVTPVEVAFKVEPPQAEVAVDGVPVARGRALGVPLLPGTYTLTASAPDHVPLSRPLVVTAGAPPATVEAALERRIYKGFLAVKTTPADGVTVLIDGQKVGETPLAPISLDTRRYLVRFERDGYDLWHRYVTIERESTTTLEPVLERTLGGGAAAAPSPAP